MNPEYEFALECDEEFNGPKLQYFDRVAGENKPFSDLNDYDIYLQSRIGVVMHFENAGYDRTNPETIGKLKTYITGIAQHNFRATVGATFSIDGERDCLTLSRVVLYATLDEDVLFREVERFVNLFEVWTHIISNYEGRKESDEPPIDLYGIKV